MAKVTGEPKSKRRRVKLTFEEWIDKKGTNAIAKFLGVSPRTVNHWRNGNYPRIEHMRRIKELTDGAIDYTQMIERDPEALLGRYIRV